MFFRDAIDGDEEEPAWARLCRLTARSVPPGESARASPIYYNDHPTRTQAEVVALLDRAIGQCLAEQSQETKLATVPAEKAVSV